MKTTDAILIHFGLFQIHDPELGGGESCHAPLNKSKASPFGRKKQLKINALDEIVPIAVEFILIFCVILSPRTFSIAIAPFSLSVVTCYL